MTIERNPNKFGKKTPCGSAELHVTVSKRPVIQIRKDRAKPRIEKCYNEWLSKVSVEEIRYYGRRLLVK